VSTEAAQCTDSDGAYTVSFHIYRTILSKIFQLVSSFPPSMKEKNQKLQEKKKTNDQMEQFMLETKQIKT
jgi:hypothetical protein